MEAFPGILGGRYPVLTINGTSFVTDTTTTPVVTTIPLLDSGEKAPWIALGGPLSDHQVNLGVSAAVDATDGPMTSTQTLLILDTKGFSHLAVVRNATTGSDMVFCPLASVKVMNGPLPLGGDSVASALVASGATTELAIPTLGNSSTRARIVMVSGQSSVFAKPGFTGEEIHSPLDGYRLRGGYSTIWNVGGHTHILATARTAGPFDIIITPLEI